MYLCKIIGETTKQFNLYVKVKIYPFVKENDPEISIPDNTKLVEKLLKHLNKCLLRDRGYHTDYIRFMDEIILLGRLEIAPTEYETGRLNYIPHHRVYHPKKSVKIHILIDCSANWREVCLNDVLLSTQMKRRFNSYRVSALCVRMPKFIFTFRVKR